MTTRVELTYDNNIYVEFSERAILPVEKSYLIGMLLRFNPQQGNRIQQHDSSSLISALGKTVDKSDKTIVSTKSIVFNHIGERLSGTYTKKPLEISSETEFALIILPGYGTKKENSQIKVRHIK